MGLQGIYNNSIMNERNCSLQQRTVVEQHVHIQPILLYVLL